MLTREMLNKRIKEFEAELMAINKQDSEDFRCLDLAIGHCQWALDELETLNLEKVDKIIVSKINWNEVPEEFPMPKKVMIDVNESTMYLLEDINGAADALCNYLSNRYGFCIEGFKVQLF